VTLRKEEAAGADTASLVALGESLVALHDWTRLPGPGFVVGLGNGLILGYLMYRSALVARPMAVLGLIGGPLIIASGVGVLFGVIEAGSVWQAIATIPEFFWELSLGI
jgi:Mg/Co/Ni transporter MgtE